MKSVLVHKTVVILTFFVPTPGFSLFAGSPRAVSIMAPRSRPVGSDDKENQTDAGSTGLETTQRRIMKSPSLIKAPTGVTIAMGQFLQTMQPPSASQIILFVSFLLLSLLAILAC